MVEPECGIMVGQHSPSPSIAPILKNAYQKLNGMSLFPAEDTLAKEIELWGTFAASLNSEEYKGIFNKMLSNCYTYANAVNAKGELFPIDSLLMSLLLSQQKMVDWLSARVYDKQHH